MYERNAFEPVLRNGIVERIGRERYNVFVGGGIAGEIQDANHQIVNRKNTQGSAADELFVNATNAAPAVVNDAGYEKAA